MSARLPTYHIIDYIAWRNGGRTECCGVPVTDPTLKNDTCGQGPKEPGTRRCAGVRPTEESP